MSLLPGTRLGPYEVAAQIGEGGMGQVYRALDTKLGRDVAIKILPEAFVHDAERLARFTREAKTLASLNHPNIAGIYGLEASDGFTALVMELVEGEDRSAIIAHGQRHPEAASVSEPLRDSDSAAGRRGGAAIEKSRPPAERAARGLSISDTLQIARQIADALEAAHEQGIIHRDLKPANIKVRDDGTVKVLDFGLAKAIEPAFAQGASAGQAPSLAPTITSPAMTQMGMILGTAASMAPEQARGRSVDKRADIWAFGCVLFELLTGRRAFEGDDVSSALAKVLEREPALDLVPANVPPVVRKGLRRCLQKDPRQRVRDMGDVRLALDGAFDEAEATQAVGKPRAPWVVATAVLAAFAVAGWLWPRSGAQVERRDLTLTIAPPSATGIVPLNYAASGPTISPNGTMVAYRDGSNGFQLRRLDALGLERLDLPAGLADFGAWSAGSRSFVTDSGGELWQIGVPG